MATCAFATLFDHLNASSVFNNIKDLLQNSMENKDDAESFILVSCSNITDLFIPIIIILFSCRSCTKGNQSLFLRFEKNFVSLLLFMALIATLYAHKFRMFSFFRYIGLSGKFVPIYGRWHLNRTKYIRIGL